MNMLATCAGLLAAAGFPVEKWSDGDLAVPVEIGDRLWHVFVTFDEQWIRLNCAVTPVTSATGGGMFRSLLRMNADDRRVRAAIVGECVAIRCDYPILDFSEADFLVAVSEMRSVVGATVERFGLLATSEGEIGRE